VLPTFVVIGAQKAGTTTLYEWLRQHPEVFLPDLKETNFFLAEGPWHLGIEWYRELYAEGERRGARHAGDVSPGYTMFPVFTGAPERMAGVLPEAKLVYIIRDPIARMRSSYQQSLSDGTEDQPMAEALLLHTRYLYLSLYALQLEQYLEWYDRSQVLVLRAEDLQKEPAATLATFLSFIGLDPAWRPANLNERFNVSADKRVAKRTVYVAERILREHGRVTQSRRLNRYAIRHRLLSRPPSEAESTVSDEVLDDLRTCVVPDMQRLRAIVGPDFDLYGLA
jgi:hypothetical protein